MNDVVLEGFVKNFADARGLAHLTPDKLFDAFAFSSILKKYHQADITDLEDGVLVGGGGDGGLDAIAIMVGGRPIRTKEDIQYFIKNRWRLDVEFVFVQAKTSASFSAADIGNFTFGVEQFFASINGSEMQIEFNSDVLQLADQTRYLYEQSIKMQENPRCFLYYITGGKWTNALDLSGRLSNGERKLRQLKMFSSVKAKPIDAELLKAIYREVERGVVKEIEFSKTAVFPRIKGVEDAYIGLLPGNEFIKMVSTDNDELNREIFYDNVRDFQGQNPVNGEINHTLIDEQRRHNFPLLNNGITIVAREISRRGDTFTISDFQIVNGCQTTHILFQNKRRIGADTFVPVKLLATTERQVISEVIKATNRQTEVLPEALESLTPFHKELEDFYETREGTRDPADRIYYERRSKQFVWDKIHPRNIVSLTAQIKSFIGMFLNEPHSHPRYYGELLGAYTGKLFANNHKPAPYYTSGITLLAVEKWLNSRSPDRELRTYKYQLLMLLRATISGQNVPRFNSNAITEYSLKIVDVLRDPTRSDEAFNRAAALLLAGLDKFGRQSREGNRPNRLRVFTDLLIRNLPSTGNMQEAPQSGNRLSITAGESGRIIRFDELKNYGFIKRDTGGDIFVHRSEINRIPWHITKTDQRVRYVVRPNPKSPGKQMACEVVLVAPD